MHPDLSIEIAAARRSDRMSDARRRNAVAAARRRRRSRTDAAGGGPAGLGARATTAQTAMAAWGDGRRRAYSTIGSVLPS
jgi:hypothetical protein